MKQEELKNLKEKALKQFKEGKSLFGKEGAFAPLLQEFLEEALEAEMAEHLNDPEKGRESGNKRNGKGSKTVKSTSGEFTIQTPQDRNSSFEPEIIKKRQRILADNLEDKIIPYVFLSQGKSLNILENTLIESRNSPLFRSSIPNSNMLLIFAIQILSLLFLHSVSTESHCCQR